jgi:hypothetical protein
LSGWGNRTCSPIETLARKGMLHLIKEIRCDQQSGPGHRG